MKRVIGGVSLILYGIERRKGNETEGMSREEDAKGLYDFFPFILALGF
jgi:hypothetical protein